MPKKEEVSSRTSGPEGRNSVDEGGDSLEGDENTKSHFLSIDDILKDKNTDTASCDSSRNDAIKYDVAESSLRIPKSSDSCADSPRPDVFGSSVPSLDYMAYARPPHFLHYPCTLARSLGVFQSTSWLCQSMYQRQAYIEGNHVFNVLFSKHPYYIIVPCFYNPVQYHVDRRIRGYCFHVKSK